MKSVLRALAFIPMTLANAYGRLLAMWWPSAGWAWNDLAYRQASSLTADVTHEHGGREVRMTFHVPNAVCRYRADTFSTKEPETLEWIDTFGGQGTFFDIGANVGLYSIYYAKTHPGKVYAFEPSALNLGLLARNISVNALAGRIVIVPNPLTEVNQVARFHLSMIEEGGAMSTFGADYGYDGMPLQPVMDYATVGVALDFLIDSGMIPDLPSMMKIDVDGIEHLVLRGSVGVLASSILRTVLIEVNDEFHLLASEVSQALKTAGFVLADQRHSEMFEGGAYANTFNQIWIRGRDVGDAVAVSTPAKN